MHAGVSVPTGEKSTFNYKPFCGTYLRIRHPVPVLSNTRKPKMGTKPAVGDEPFRRLPPGDPPDPAPDRLEIGVGEPAGKECPVEHHRPHPIQAGDVLRPALGNNPR